MKYLGLVGKNLIKYLASPYDKEDELISTGLNWVENAK